MPLLNYTTKVPAEKTAGEIMSLLAKKRAFQVTMQFSPDGQPSGLNWWVETPHGPLAFALPVNVDAAFNILTAQRVLPGNPKARMEQAERTAWRIVKEWVQAQMALIETEMADMEEVFLPYMLADDHRTLYQTMADRGFRLSQGGHSQPDSAPIALPGATANGPLP